ncbi:MAG: Holliday junction branch migration protein RuvA [Lachnospiraceae bacterium]|nr:Holliday junction branch migration protein RuvA [Lachnospiraceae bacterium]
MLSYIKGTLAAVTQDGIVIENNGIGYDIKTPDLTGNLPPVGSSYTVYTYLYVREDMLCLYGFSSKNQLRAFKLLITVSGVGPKAAMAILSTLSVDELHFAILSDDSKTISKAPGIGPKGAKRIIIELKDKLDLEDAFETAFDVGDGEVSDDVMSLTASGLVSLGYSNSEALRAIQAVEGASGMDAETLLSEALKKLLTI